MLIAIVAVYLAAGLVHSYPTANLPHDHPFVRRLMSTRATAMAPRGSAGLSSQEPVSLYSGCQPLDDADLLNIDDTTMQAITDYILSQTVNAPNPDGSTLASEAFACWVDQNGCAPGSNNIETLKQNLVFGAGKNGGGSNTNMVLYVPQSDENDWLTEFYPNAGGYSASWLYVCLGTPEPPKATTGTDCQVTETNLQGSIFGTSASISTTIDQQISVALTAEESTTQSYTAGMSYTITSTVGVPDEDSVQNSLTISFSYEYTSEQSKSQTVTQQVDQSVQVTVNPTDGQTCDLVLSQRQCQVSVSTTVPVTFKGYLAHYITQQGTTVGSKLPEMSCEESSPETCSDGHYAVYEGQEGGGNSNGARVRLWDMQEIVTAQVSSPPVIINTAQGSLTASGNYLINCTTGSAAGASSSISSSSSSSVSTSSVSSSTSSTASSTPSPTPNAGYTPTLQCPADGLGSMQDACSASVPDYLQSGAVVSDYKSWAARGLSYTQHPAPNSTFGYGQTQVTFTVSGPGVQTITCTSPFTVIPPWYAEFTPQLQTLEYPSDGSQVDAYYLSEYVGTCDAKQAGVCLISNIQSSSASGFKWSDTSASKYNPEQSILFTTSGSWPSTDTLTFYLQCFDTYGNNGGAMFQQKATEVPVNTLTVGVPDTVTLHTSTVDAFTKTVTKSTTTPVVTDTVDTATVYDQTVYDGTTTVTEHQPTTVLTTHTVTHTVVDPTTVRGSPTNTTVVTAAPSTVTVTHNKTVTITGIASTVTRTATTCISEVPERRQFPDYTPGVGTTTYTNPSLTTTITDSTDTDTTTVSDTRVVTDSTDTAIGPVRTVTKDDVAHGTLTTLSTEHVIKTVTKTLSSTVIATAKTTDTLPGGVTTITKLPKSTVTSTVERTFTVTATGVGKTVTITPACKSTSLSSSAPSSKSPIHSVSSHSASKSSSTHASGSSHSMSKASSSQSEHSAQQPSKSSSEKHWSSTSSSHSSSSHSRSRTSTSKASSTGESHSSVSSSESVHQPSKSHSDQQKSSSASASHTSASTRPSQSSAHGGSPSCPIWWPPCWTYNPGANPSGAFPSGPFVSPTHRG